MSGPETPDDTARVNQKTVGKVLKRSKRWNPRWLLAFIVVLTGALTLTLFIVARFYIKQPPEDTKAFIPGMLGILTLVVIAVQVWINQRQWVVMRDGLEKTQNLINQNERFIKASQRQARAAEKALRLAEYTLAEMKHSRELEYAAMLFIADVYLSDPLENEEGEPQRIKASYVNVGKTPATNVQIYVRTDLSEISPERFLLQGELTKFSPGPVLNSHDNTIAFQFPNLTPTKVDLLHTGGLFFYVSGRIEYDDIFGKPHWTSFCFYFNPPTTMTPSEFGNSSDYRTNHGISVEPFHSVTVFGKAEITVGDPPASRQSESRKTDSE